MKKCVELSNTKKYSLLLTVMTCQMYTRDTYKKQMVILRGIIKFSTWTFKKHDLTENLNYYFWGRYWKINTPPPQKKMQETLAAKKQRYW